MDGGWDFTCQHGPHECRGNKFQACLLDMVPDQERQVPLINCMMASQHPPPPTDHCLHSLGITLPSTEDVEMCGDGMEGSVLLHNIGLETHGLQPRLTSVPWILFNDVIT